MSLIRIVSPDYSAELPGFSEAAEDILSTCLRHRPSVAIEALKIVWINLLLRGGNMDLATVQIGHALTELPYINAMIISGDDAQTADFPSPQGSA